MIERQPFFLPGRRPDNLSPREAAFALGVSLRTLWRLIGAHKIKTFKIGTRTLIKDSVLQDYVATLH